MEGQKLIKSLADRIQQKLALKGQSLNSLELNLRHAFKFYDMRDQGHLNFQSFCTAIERVGVFLDSKDQSALRQLFDPEGKNKVNYGEFIFLIVDCVNNQFSDSQAKSQSANKEIISITNRKRHIENLSAVLNQHCLLNLFTALVKADSSSNGLIDFYTLSKTIANLTSFDPDDLRAALDGLDQKIPELYDYAAFFDVVLNRLSTPRMDLTRQLFAEIAADREAVSSEYFLTFLRIEDHPDLQRGTKSLKALQEELLAGLKSLLFYNRSKFVNLKIFGDFVRFLGSSIKSDSYFQLVLENLFGRKLASVGSYQDIERQRQEVSEQQSGREETLSVHQHSGKNQIVQVALSKMSEEFRLKGLAFLMGFLRILKSSESAQTKRISAAGFFSAVAGCKLPLTKQEQDLLFQFFRKPGQDFFDDEAFNQELIPCLSSERAAQVEALYATFEGSDKNKVRIVNLKHDYTPLIANPKNFKDKTELPSKLEFENSLDNYLFVIRNSSEFISRAEFIDFYKYISFFYGSENQFEQSLKNSWKKFTEKQTKGESQVAFDKKAKYSYNPPFGVNELPNNANEQSQRQVNRARISENLEQKGFIAGVSSAQLNQNKQKQNRFQSELQDESKKNQRNAEVPEDQPAQQSIENPIDFLAEAFGQMNAFSVFVFIQSLMQQDPKDTGSVSKLSLEFCLKSSLQIKGKVDAIVEAFQKSFSTKDGKISYFAILQSLSNLKQSPEFSRLNKRAFKTLDIFHREMISMDVIKNRFNPKQHPKVVRKETSDYQLVQDFNFSLETFAKFKVF